MLLVELIAIRISQETFLKHENPIQNPKYNKTEGNLSIVGFPGPAEVKRRGEKIAGNMFN